MGFSYSCNENAIQEKKLEKIKIEINKIQKEGLKFEDILPIFKHF